MFCVFPKVWLTKHPLWPVWIWGGGKAVIIGDPKTQKSEGLFQPLVNLSMDWMAAISPLEDVGTYVTDMEYVLWNAALGDGIPKDFGGSVTQVLHAHGVLMGIKSQCSRNNLKQIHWACVLLFKVLAMLDRTLFVILFKREKVILSDIDPAKVKTDVWSGMQVLNP